MADLNAKDFAYLQKRLLQLEEDAEKKKVEYFRALSGLHLMEGDAKEARNQTLDRLANERNSLLAEADRVRIQLAPKKTHVKGEGRPKYYRQRSPANPDDPLR